MNKKIISALLFGAMLIASTSTFVSCSYDDDITDLRNDLNATATDLNGLVDQKMKAVDAEIASLGAQADALEAAYEAADEALEEAIANATNDAKGYADVQAAQAQAAAIDAAQKMVSDAQAALEAALTAVNTTLGEHGKSISALLEADKQLTSAIAAAQARADQAYALAEQAQKLATDNAAAIKSLNEALEGLKKTVANLEGQVSVLGDKVSALEAAAQKNAADIAAQAKVIEELEKSNAKALEAAVKAAKDELLKEIEANAAEVEALKAEVAAAKELAEAAVETAKAYTDAEINKIKENLGEVYDVAKAAQATADEALAAAAKAAEDAAKAIEAAQKASQAEAAVAQATAEKAVADAKAAADVAVAAQATANKAAADITKLSSDLEAVKKAYADADAKIAKDIEKINKAIETINATIDTVKKDLKSANENLVYESKRLKSLVFAPTAYVDGIECIKFVTLNYMNWANYYADAANGTDTKLYYIDDANTTVEYLVNPENVLKSDITALSYISNEATNTRAVNQNAPLDVKSFDIKNGVMTVKLDKKNTESFGTNRDKFTVVSLKATLSDKFLTEEEVKNGEKAEVYSDWARLYETAVTPYIHNVLTNNANHTHNEGAAAAHFWTFSQAYGSLTANPASTKLPTSYNDQHVAKEVVYTESIDLMTLVEVCDKAGNHYDPAAYGLEFRFTMMNYLLKNDNVTTDCTDQKHFGKLNGTVLTSTARDGQTEKNRDAIGRQPMIQVVLFDKVNNKTVDVKYFKIKWVANTPDAPSVTVKDFGELGAFTKAYGCGISIQERVLEQKVNSLYTFAGTSGMSRDEFHQTYELVPGLYASLAEINKATPAALTTTDTFVEQPDNSGAGQTWNYLYTINTANHKIVMTPVNEYLAGKKEFTVYGYFRNKINHNERIAFSLKFTLTINRMGLDGYNLDQTMWANDLRHINPALETDANLGNTTYATTQIVGSLLEGYIKNGQTPGDVIEMMKKVNGNTPNAKFVFDEDVVATWGNGWTVSADGSTLLKGLVVAATVDPTYGTIQLKESNNGASNSVPTTAAKLLVGNTAPVKIVADWCDITDEMEKRNVKFLTPLAFSSNEAQVELYDITAGGSSEATIAGKLQIKEVYTTNKRVVWDNKTTNSETKPALVAWYKVSTPVYDVANAKTNISLNGSIGSACTTKLSDLKNSNGTQKYTVAVDPATSKVTFHNMSGNAIGQFFKIEIPVTVTTKWQDGMTAKIVVTVKPSI